MKAALTQRLSVLSAAIDRITAEGVPDEDIPDLAGHLRHAENRLAEYRRGLCSEIPAGVQVGSEYQIRVPNERVRSYNGPAIIAAVADRVGGSIAAAVLALVQEGAMRLTFVHTRLQEVATRLGVELREVNRELTEGDQADLDAPHIGFYWKQGNPVVEAAGKEPFLKKGKR